jgi:ABC-type branched-subunit amino acid transport system substrate-binding protein
MNKRIIYGLIVVILIVGGFYLTNTQTNDVANQNTETKTVNFGAVLALSGYAAIDGENIKDGIELAKTDLAKENIALNIEYYDDATDPKKTIAGVEYMNGKGIKTIFGPTWSYQISAALPTLSKYGMTAYIADTSSDVVEGSQTDKERLVHGVSPIYQIAAPTTKWIKDNNVTKLAILTVDGAWGIAHTEAWKKAASDAGISAGLTEMFDYGSEPTVIATLVVKAKAQGVDGIVWTGTEAGAVVLVKKMQELGYNVPVLGTNYLNVASDSKKIEVGNYNVSMIESARSESFNEKYRAVYNREPNKYAESSYDLTMIAVQAELSKGTKTTREYLLSREHDGFAKAYRFDEMGDITNLYWSVTKI